MDLEKSPLGSYHSSNKLNQETSSSAKTSGRELVKKWEIHTHIFMYELQISPYKIFTTYKGKAILQGKTCYKPSYQ